jgi:hypothetical protein
MGARIPAPAGSEILRSRELVHERLYRKSEREGTGATTCRPYATTCPSPAAQHTSSPILRPPPNLPCPSTGMHPLTLHRHPITFHRPRHSHWHTRHPAPFLPSTLNPLLGNRAHPACHTRTFLPHPEVASDTGTHCHYQGGVSPHAMREAGTRIMYHESRTLKHETCIRFPH